MGGNDAWLTLGCGAFVAGVVAGNGGGNTLDCEAAETGCWVATVATDGKVCGKARDRGPAGTCSADLALATGGDGSGFAPARGAAETGGSCVTVGGGGAARGVAASADRTAWFLGAVFFGSVVGFSAFAV